MKKMFTLVLTAVLLTGSVFAQYGPGKDYSKDSRNTGWHDNDKKGGFYFYTARERDMDIAKINREYDRKINAVKNKFMMNRFQKQRQISFLEDERRDEIRMVFAKFNDRRNKGDDRGYGKRW